MTDTGRLQVALARFCRERDWEKFHTPKNLAMGLAVEAAELLELFLWKDENASRILDAKRHERLREEIGDVQLYLINLAGKYGLDPIECAAHKLELNEQKYPAELVRGSDRKYDEYSRG